MRIPSHLDFIAITVGLLVATLALPASAGSFYTYETENGGIAFTDDAKQIPARYRDDAQRIERDGLDDFDRYTPSGEGRPAAYAGRVDQRLEHLRDLNARTVSPHAVAAPRAGHSGMVVRSGRDGQDVDAYLDPGQTGEPVIVETIRSRPAGSPVTRHITVVRRGDEILSVVAPVLRHSATRSTVDERELFE